MYCFNNIFSESSMREISKYMKKRYKMIYYVVCGLFIFLLPVLIYTDNLIKYLAVQGFGQAKIIVKAEKLEYYLSKPDFPEEKKRKLLLIREIQNFAVNEIGLTDNGSYHKVYDQHEKPLLWLVQACPPYSLEPYTWKFPFVGRLSYKGYFSKDDALKESNRLKKLGYDVYIRNPSAWSTLGIIKDPVFSGMLDRSDGDLANVILHEMTHSTVFLKNNLQFNENIATFIGDNASALFIERKYGADSCELSAYLNSNKDDVLFCDHIMNGSEKLSNLYKSFISCMSDEEKNAMKNALIKEIIAAIKTLSFNDANAFKGYDSFHPNNAWFAGFNTYRNDLSAIKNEFADNYNSDFKKYITYLKTLK